jgi:hypothetical protein
MSLTSQGPGWWQANDGKWYPPGKVSPDLPAPPKEPLGAKGCLLGLLGVVVFVGVIMGLFYGGFAIDHAATGQVKFTSHVDSYQPSDSSHLAIYISVTNVGSKAGVPQCQVEALSPGDADSGDAVFSGHLPIDPGHVGNVSGLVIVTNNGAGNVSSVTARC